MLYKAVFKFIKIWEIFVSTFCLKNLELYMVMLNNK